MSSTGTMRQAFTGRLSTPWVTVLGAVVAVALVRLVTLGTPALTDNTEARYAAIGWQMFSSGDVVTPRLHLGGKLVPFWGKPPLFFWMVALSYAACGVSEWAARLPNFLLDIALVVATIAFGRRLWDIRVGLLAGLILASSGLFFVLSGACVLDMALSTTVSLAMMSFALFSADDANRVWWGRAFFASLGLGCLAKGPVAVALVLLAVGAWIVLTRQWNLVRRVPWASGLAIGAVIASPWYLLAERATPGFLRYFLINEHILRYVRHDYGDLYGNGRVQPFGASWAMLVIAFLPWTPVLVRQAFVGGKRRGRTAATGNDPWMWYLLLWGLAPAVFFTLCRQVLITYLLPGVPGLALATAVVLVRWLGSEQLPALLKGLRVQAAVLGALLIAGVAGEAIVHSSSWTVVGSVLALAVFCAIAWHGHVRSDATTLLAAAGLGGPLVIAVAVSAAGPWIGESFSTKAILLAVARLPQRVEAVTFPFGDRYSADFYEEACLGGRIDRRGDQALRSLARGSGDPADGVFVFARNDWQSLDARIRGGLLPIAETPHWIACRVAPVSPGDERVGSAQRDVDPRTRN